MLIHDEKVCDTCNRNTHHVDYDCCRLCAGFVRCRDCRQNFHHKRYARCYECERGLAEGAPSRNASA